MDWPREDRRPFRAGEPQTVLFSNKGSYGGDNKDRFGGVATCGALKTSARLWLGSHHRHLSSTGAWGKDTWEDMGPRSLSACGRLPSWAGGTEPLGNSRVLLWDFAL